MTSPFPVDSIRHFHAHIYFDAGSRDKAWALRERIGATFDDVTVGRFHEKEVGPHSAWMFQVAFGPGRFGSLVPWLALNREGLSILVHPGTGRLPITPTTRCGWAIACRSKWMCWKRIR